MSDQHERCNGIGCPGCDECGGQIRARVDVSDAVRAGVFSCANNQHVIGASGRCPCGRYPER